jgi:GT2 family glycosyltransferase
MTQPDVSILIVSWNVRDLLLDCLRSIASCGDVCQREIVVVDNLSQDGSAEAVRSAFPDVRWIQNAQNAGFAGGNNLGFAHCAGRYVLLLNPDTLVFPGALDALVTFLDEHPQAGAAGSRLLNPDGSLQACCFAFPTVAREFWRLMHLDRLLPFGTYDMRRWSETAPRGVDAVQGTSLALRPSALDGEALFDTRYFMYTEEIDLCYRLHQAQWGVFYVPASCVRHYGGQSTRQTALPMFLSLYRTKTQFIRKHHGALNALLYRAVLLLTALPRLLPAAVAWMLPAPRRAALRRTAYDYWRLIQSLPGF